MAPLAVCLVLALDGSQSFSDAHWTLTVEAHARALRSPKVAQAAEAGGLAIAALGFAGRPHVLLPWSVLRTAEDAEGFAAGMAEHAPERRFFLGDGTGTGRAVFHALDLLDALPASCERKVIDVATDGESNTGPPADTARDAADHAEVRINVVGYRTQQGDPAEWARDNLVTPGGFALEAVTWEDWVRAIEKKLHAEVAGVPR